MGARPARAVEPFAVAFTPVYPDGDARRLERLRGESRDQPELPIFFATDAARTNAPSGHGTSVT